MNDVQQLFSLIATYGVPIVLSVYLVYWITSRLNSKLDKLINAFNELNNNIVRLIEKIDNLKDIVREGK